MMTDTLIDYLIKIWPLREDFNDPCSKEKFSHFASDIVAICKQSSDTPNTFYQVIFDALNESGKIKLEQNPQYPWHNVAITQSTGEKTL